MADDSYGLLGGLAQGVKEGLGTYQQFRQMNRQDAIDEENKKNKALLVALQQKQLQAQIAEKGLQENPTGGYGLTPQEQEKRDLERTEKLGGLMGKGVGPANGSPLSKYTKDLQFLSAPKGSIVGEASEAKKIAAQGLAGYRAQNMDLRTSKNAGDVGAHYESDPILKLSKTNLNSLTRSSSILDNPNKPVTTKDLNLAYNDYINAVAAGGTATEGKINRELPTNWETTWNDFKQRAGESDDLRKTSAGKQLIDMLKENISTVRRDMSQAIGEQAYNIHSNSLDSTNPKAVETNKRKLKEYAPEKYQELYGPKPAKGMMAPTGQPGSMQPGAPQPQQQLTPQDQRAIQWAQSNRGNPDAEQILKLHGIK